VEVPAPSRFVVVHGPPAAGKSSIAGPLADRLRLPLVAKDVIKEAIADELAPDGMDLDLSHRLGAVSFAVLWSVAAGCREAVLEGNFLPAAARPRLAALDPNPVEVFCRCPLDVCISRYERRLTDRHAVHVPVVPPIEQFARYDEPLGLGTTIEVRTDRPIDLDELTHAVARLRAGTGTGSGRR
jgi:predicted kinase